MTKKTVQHRSDVEQARDVEQNVHDVQGAFEHAGRRVGKARAHEDRQHEADEGGDDAIVGGVVEEPFGEDAHGAEEHEAQQHAGLAQHIYTQRLCVMSMMSTL